MIVANEQVDVFVTVHNPLAFDLEVADLSLLWVYISSYSFPV